MYGGVCEEEHSPENKRRYTTGVTPDPLPPTHTHTHMHLKFGLSSNNLTNTNTSTHTHTYYACTHTRTHTHVQHTHTHTHPLSNSPIGRPHPLISLDWTSLLLGTHFNIRLGELVGEEVVVSHILTTACGVNAYSTCSIVYYKL